MADTDLIERYLVHLRETGASPRTIEGRLGTLTILDRELPYGLASANAEELREWLWRDGLAIGSRETYYGAIAGFFRWAGDAGWLDWDPTQDMKRPQVPRRLPRPATDEQVTTALNRAAEPYRLWAHLGAYAGLRCIEVYRLDREHVTQRAIEVYGKGGVRRVVPTHPVLWEIIEPLPAGPISGAPDERHISIRFAVYCRRRLGLPGLTMHRLRHWFATMILRERGNLRVVQELLGHASPTTTALYTAVSSDQLADAVAALPRLTARARGAADV